MAASALAAFSTAHCTSPSACRTSLASDTLATRSVVFATRSAAALSRSSSACCCSNCASRALRARSCARWRRCTSLSSASASSASSCHTARSRAISSTVAAHRRRRSDSRARCIASLSSNAFRYASSRCALRLGAATRRAGAGVGQLEPALPTWTVMESEGRRGGGEVLCRKLCAPPRSSTVSSSSAGTREAPDGGSGHISRPLAA
ncbi:hypothetical protein AB1Y20_002590 [Prymnesium parvum]|uniref:Uncharacterized protein n=1 Tax=Prymnesium parvum TaxID=97485 RepID=A0AB34J8Z9_PRYPA